MRKGFDIVDKVQTMKNREKGASKIVMIRCDSDPSQSRVCALLKITRHSENVPFKNVGLEVSLFMSYL